MIYAFLLSFFKTEVDIVYFLPVQYVSLTHWRSEGLIHCVVFEEEKIWTTVYMMDIETFCASRVGYISLILESCTAQTLTIKVIILRNITIISCFNFKKVT